MTKSVRKGGKEYKAVIWDGHINERLRKTVLDDILS
jgi:hypothetical protein